MCGRYVSPSQAAIEREWHIGRQSPNRWWTATRYNVVPTTQVPVVRRAAESEQLELVEARWGLIPPWWKQAKAPTSTINARSEEAAGKPMWRQPYRTARCLIPALGWYEWREQVRTDLETGEVRKLKQPHYLCVAPGRVVGFAGLMSYGALPGGEPQLTCAILTRAASPSAAEVHDRMPVVLEQSAHAAWLDPELKDAANVAEIIKDGAIEKVQHHPVRTLVNKPGTEGPELIELLTSMPER